MTPIIEHRHYPRFAVVARCFVATYGSDTYEATTRNISRTGLLLQLALNGAEQEAPRVGEAVIIDVELPTNRRFGPKCLRCRGTVVRAGARGEIAVQALQMEFRDQDSKLRSKKDTDRNYEDLQAGSPAWGER